MSIPYSGSTPINFTFTDAGTRLDLVNNLNTQLKNAGWSVISGDGTNDVLMKTAVTPQGLSIRVRIYDPGSGNCAQITIKTSTGVTSSLVSYLLPASVQWRIWACKYWFGMFKTTAANRLAPRGIVFAGTYVSLPSGVLTSMGSDLEAGFLSPLGNSDTDTSSSGKGTWRSHLGAFTLLNVGGVQQQIFKSTIGGAFPSLALQFLSYYSNAVLDTWADGSYLTQEAIVSCQSFGGAIGMLADALVTHTQLNGETDTFTFDGKNWMPITDLSSTYNATLCVVIP